MNIELKEVNYIYNQGLAGEVRALCDISFMIDEPQFIAVIGSTGSGKSTLIQLLNGLLQPTSGSILFDGAELTPAAQKQMLRWIRKKVGLVFQYPEYQLFDETVLSDVSFGPKNLGFTAEEASVKAAEALKTVGIPETRFDKSPFELSGGEQRRVAIAGVLAMDPEILVLDEPTAGLDPQGKEEILKCIRDLQYKGKKTTVPQAGDPARTMTVVFVSHNMDEVAAYADRVIVMHEGKIISDGRTEEVFRDYPMLESIGLKAPEATYLCAQLNIPDILTIEDAADAIEKKYGYMIKQVQPNV